ncbi:MAG: thioredoxin-disulfide reductase [Anaerovoracaceae bacterium]
MMNQIYDIIIIGGGPAGYTAALYSSRAGLDTLVIEKMSAGGQMALTDKIDNYPGFDDGIDGFSLGEKMKTEAERFGTCTKSAAVQSADLKSDPKVIKTSDDICYGRTVVIATGAEPRELGVDGEKELVGRGVSYCAACDGMFFNGKTVAVVGGGNTAAADILLLSRVASKVFVVHRRDTISASKVYHDALMSADNVEFFWNSQVIGILSDSKVTGVRMRDLETGEETERACDGILVAIGRKPASELAAGQLDLDERGYIVADESTKTNIPGVFAAGDVRTKVLRQVITAAADGAMAAHYAEEYLASKNK